MAYDRTHAIGCACALILLARCSSPPPTDHDAGTTIVPCMVDASPSRPLWFVLQRLAIDPMEDPLGIDVGRTGFNLDDRYSSDGDTEGCLHTDSFALFDTDQNCATNSESCPATPNPGCASIAGTRCRGGVDNQFPFGAQWLQTGSNPSAHVDLRAASALEESAGRFVILLELLDVDDCRNDSSVRVRVFRGFAAPGTPCASPTPDGIYQIDRGSLRAGGTTDDDAMVELAGTLRDGRVRVAGEASTDALVFPLRWPASAQPPQTWLDLPLHHPLLAFDLAFQFGSRGNFGGWITGDDVVTAVTPLLQSGYVPQVRTLVAFLVDMMIGGVCFDTMATPEVVLGGISIGFGFDIVPARIDTAHPIVGAAMPGSCAYEASGADGGVDD